MNILSIPKNWQYFSDLRAIAGTEVVPTSNPFFPKVKILVEDSESSKYKGNSTAKRYNEFLEKCYRVKNWIKNAVQYKEDGKWDIDELQLIEFCLRVRDDVCVIKQKTGRQTVKKIEPSKGLLVTMAQMKFNQAK